MIQTHTLSMLLPHLAHPYTLTVTHTAHSKETKMKPILPILLIATLFLAACGDSPSPTPAPTAPAQQQSTATPLPSNTPATTDTNTLKPGLIVGTASYADGKPLTNANIVIRGTTLAGANTYFETQVDANGRYSQQTPNGLYQITAYTNVTYNDRTYGIWLDPTDGINTPSQGSTDGLVKDFVWRISGPTPAAKSKPNDPHSYYGGIIDLGDNAQFEINYNNGNLVEPHTYPVGSKILLTLTPTSPLIDGSAGKVLNFEIAPDDLTTNVLRDIPVGDYTAAATLLDASGTKFNSLLVATILPTGKIGEPVVPNYSAPVIFRPLSVGDYGFQELPMFILPTP